METNKYLMRAEEVANILGVSTTFAYKLMSKLNKELAEKGYLVISGRINRKYFEEHFYGMSTSRIEETKGV